MNINEIRKIIEKEDKTLGEVGTRLQEIRHIEVGMGITLNVNSDRIELTNHYGATTSLYFNDEEAMKLRDCLSELYRKTQKSDREIMGGESEV